MTRLLQPNEKNLLRYFLANLAATFIHFADNIIRLHSYPDLPTTQASDIALFWLVMTPFGLAGYWLYRKGERRLSFYSFYLYCIMNLIALGHYLPSRLRGGFMNYGFEIHLFIWLEAATALVLLWQVVGLARKEKAPQSAGPEDDQI
jgi:hypothetical protein